MTRHTSASRAVRETARRSLALRLGALLLFATSSMRVPRSASADKGTPTWKQVGQLTTHTNLERSVAEKDWGAYEPPIIVSSSFSQTTDSVRYAWFYGQDRYEKDGVALTETFDWNLPPKTIPVGHEVEI
ncbi:MAG: hypothetical protein IJH04_02125 [Eggerthellaceae bacterium]|nr:hypothetical protein [Eggerthellaceae bacterium]